MSSSTLHSGLNELGGMILQIPKGSASRLIRSMYLIGSLNSFSVGRKTGASTRCACCPSLGNFSKASIGPKHEFADEIPEELGEVIGIFSSLILWLLMAAAMVGFELDRPESINRNNKKINKVRKEANFYDMTSLMDALSHFKVIKNVSGISNF